MEVDSFAGKFCKNTDIFDGKITRIRDSFFLADESLLEIKNKIKISPEAAGVFLGEAKKGVFYPSSALLDIISRNSDKKIFVNKKTAWLFLCGRDIFGQGIVKANEKKTGELVLVQNEADENLGYGKIVLDLSNKDKMVIKNYFDKGNFIRREHRK